MIDYSKLSDFEINLAVTSLLYGCQGWEIDRTNTHFFHFCIDGSGYCQQEIGDYCNNWQYIGPIIEREEIGVFWDADEWCATNASGFEIQRGLNKSIDYSHKNPKRAAAICYLMMKESE